MGAIPNSDSPGLLRLHSRASTALARCHESEDVDFKESAAWKDLKWKIVKAALGMANLRDGGLIVVGLSERDERWHLTGVSEEHLATFDPDTILGAVNAYASPFVEMDAAVVRYDGRDYLALDFKEFRETPVVCKKNGPEGEGIVKGAVYVRPPGVPRTTRVTDAVQMHDLLELAGEKRGRRILEVAKRVGLVEPATDRQKFDDELGEL